jgi:hypothetical protein
MPSGCGQDSFIRNKKGKGSSPCTVMKPYGRTSTAALMILVVEVLNVMHWPLYPQGKLSVMSIEWESGNTMYLVYVFCVDLRTNSDYFTVQH